MSVLVLEVGVRDLPNSTQLFRFPKHPVRIGRLPANDLVLAHSSVADHHAQVTRREGQFLFTDLNTRGGTWIGGRGGVLGSWSVVLGI